MGARRGRSAYTLLEVLLVLAIIVIAAAMMIPTLDSMYGYHKMNACVDKVRAAWTVARSAAIEDSRPYRFAISGGRYRVAPDSDEFWTGDENAGSNSDNPGYVFEGALPPGIHFQAEKGQPSTTAPENAEEEKIGSPAHWITRAIFLPDGTAREDADFLFQIPGARSRSIHLRALTGTIEVKIEGEEGSR